MEQIGAVKLNYDSYDGEDLYTDGHIEDEILKIVMEEKDEHKLEEIVYKDTRWPILYHLSPIRKNLIDWITVKESSKMLEIGAGCGALTGSLCGKAQQVYAVELSKKRAQILAHRHQKHSNLEVLVGNFNKMNFENESMDYVTLIGVLEYAEAFLDKGENSHEVFLEKIFQILKPAGQLWLAIENKFGLKYWAGAPEDHTGNLFDGLENYPNHPKVKTFTRIELSNLLQKAGFSHLQFFYPTPDYKLPREIYSDSFLPQAGDFNGISPNFDFPRLDMFHEQKVYEQLIENQLFSEFSNSFFVICQKD